MIKVKNSENSLANFAKIGYVDESRSFAEFSKVYEVTGNGTKRLLFSKTNDEPTEERWEISIDIYGDDAAYATGDGAYVTHDVTSEIPYITSVAVVVNTYPIGDVMVSYNGESTTDRDYSVSDYYVSATYYGEAQGVTVTPSYNGDTNAIDLFINFSYA